MDAVIKEGNFNAQSVGAIFEKDVNSFKLRPENFKLLDLENKWIPTLQNELDIHDKEVSKKIFFFGAANIDKF